MTASNETRPHEPQPTPAAASARNRATAMPKWLLYGLIGKGVLVVAIVIFVLWYAGIFG